MKKLALNKQFIILFCLILLSFGGSIMAQQINSFIAGTVINSKTKKPVQGAHVEAIHTPSGTKYNVMTNLKGMYRISNVRPGGPYSIKIISIGFNDENVSDINLNLGETSDFFHQLDEKVSQLSEIVISANKQSQFQDNKMGTQTIITAEKILFMPNAGRTIGDFVRFSPQVKVSPSGAISAAGQNNRYNSFTVDGTPQNDTYGMASNGTNSGQIGFTPFSMDVIDQISVQLSPYDVKQSGFSGAGISASTKSGTNNLRISFYDFFRNQALAGKTPTDNPQIERKQLMDFNSNTVGLSIGGPIIKDKLFFFVNGELQNDNTPRDFNFLTYNPGGNTVGKATLEQLNNLQHKMINDYGYHPGSFGGIANKLNGSRLFAKIDWNINSKNKFTLRYNMTTGRKEIPAISSSSAILFSNQGQDISSTVHSVGAELKSKINDEMSNYLYVGYNNVNDDRNPLGKNAPIVTFEKEKVTLGAEEFSTANLLTQNIFTIEDNFEWYKGSHNFTFGTHNEFFNIYNLFIGNNFGKYTYGDIDLFLKDMPAKQYDRQFSKLDNITGDGSIAAANYNVAQLGFYAQDEWTVSHNFKLNYGVRIDIPMFLNTTPNNEHFNNQAIAEIAKAWQDAGAESPFAKNPAQTGSNIKPSVYISPRIGFNWDITGQKRHQLRGGIGLFTSRIPYVWPGGAYTNNGVTIGSMRVSTEGAPQLIYNPDWNSQPSLPSTAPSGNIDLFTDNFKYPQVLRANLGYDVKLPFGIIGVFDALYTKNLNNVYYENLVVVPTNDRLTGTGDERLTYKKIDKSLYPEASKYTNIFLASNTNKGYSYTISASLEKSFNFGLNLNAGYSFNRSKSINDGQSSQNSSQWRNSTVYGTNDASLKTSVYDAGNRVVASASYRINYSKYAATIVSLFYNGSYGERYGYGYNLFDQKNAGLLGDNVNSNHLMAMYVPKDQNDIKLIDIKKGAEVIVSAEQQWAALDKFISEDPYLNKMRGKVVEPNSNFTPWQNILDAKLIQEFKFPQTNGRIHKLQISFDVYNLGNMINKDWGRMYYASASFNVHQLLTFQGYQAGTKTPTFTTSNYNQKTNQLNKPATIDDNTNNLQTSRWQAQIGIKYIF